MKIVCAPPTTLKEVTYGFSVAHLNFQYLYWNLGVILSKCYFHARTVAPNCLPYSQDGDLRTGG